MLFQVHKLNEAGFVKAAFIQDVFQRALDELESACGKDGREMAIVRTKLEEACFFAKKAMAQKTENQVTDEPGLP